MIERLTIREFQTHHLLRVELDPGVTTIVGPTDAGKSAVLRALRWLALNRPGGDAFIRDGSRKTKVTLMVDGHRLVRSKGPRNIYRFGDKELVAFGSEPPVEVSRLLNVSAINFACQHDPPFWFSDSAGGVSRRLNEIVNLGAIDTTLARLNASLRASGEQKAVVASRLAEARRRRKAARVAQTADEALRRVDGLAKLAEEVNVSRATLEAILVEVTAATAACAKSGALVEAGRRVEAAGDAWWKGKTKGRRIILEDLIRSAKALYRIVSRKVPDASRLDRLLNKARDAIRKTEAVRILCNEAVLQTDTVTGLLIAAHDLEDELEAKKGETCPLCGRAWEA